ncbi:MAG TPA: hypothetical protein VFB58_11605 [Chloroflexota bacterium]|nr:hypothetical protein [Chloroflexota bacterium]
MAGASHHHAVAGKTRTVRVTLSRAEVQALADLAHVYERLGPFRAMVRLTCGSETRKRFEFVAEESRIVKEMMDTTAAEMEGESTEIALMPRTLVALWGRVLTGVQKRRQGPDADTLALRTTLAGKLAEAARTLAIRDRAALDREIATRRATEVAWMREQLDGNGG